jgi:hypothetical protein
MKIRVVKRVSGNAGRGLEMKKLKECMEGI